MAKGITSNWSVSGDFGSLSTFLMSLASKVSHVEVPWSRHAAAIGWPHRDVGVVGATWAARVNGPVGSWQGHGKGGMMSWEIVTPRWPSLVNLDTSQPTCVLLYTYFLVCFGPVRHYKACSKCVHAICMCLKGMPTMATRKWLFMEFSWSIVVSNKRQASLGWCSTLVVLYQGRSWCS